MRILAPFPAVETIMILPEPALANTIILLDERDYKITMTGNVFSYRKRSPEQKFTFTFDLTLDKMFELNEFIQNYISAQWQMIDHHDDVIVGYCETNPIALTTDKRANTILPDPLPEGHDCTTLIYENGENVVFELDFVGVLSEPVE